VTAEIRLDEREACSGRRLSDVYAKPMASRRLMATRSLVPLAAKVAGLSLIDLLGEIYDLSMEVRHAGA